MSSGYRLLNIGANAKTVKGDKLGVYKTGILYLAPANQAGTRINMCPRATEGCKSSCLYFSGRGRFTKTQQARIRKTIQFVENRESFMADLYKDILRFVRYCKKNGVQPVLRLNGTSDVLWERIPLVVNGTEYENVMSLFPEAKFYDYTKVPFRGPLPPNYKLVFSLAESNEQEALCALENGLNVAVVFNTSAKRPLPEKFWDIPVFDGDATDLRINDPDGHIVGLKAKGTAKRDKSGFVHDPINNTRPSKAANWNTSFGRWITVLG